MVGASSAGSVDARLSQGAFLALRLVDLLQYRAPVYGDAFRYQHAATERFCGDLPADSTETAHLVGLVRSAADAFHDQDVRLILPALTKRWTCSTRRRGWAAIGSPPPMRSRAG